MRSIRCAALLLTLCAGASIAEPTRYSVQILTGALGQEIAETYLWDINAHGEMTGSVAVNLGFQGFYIAPGESPVEAPMSYPLGINDLGQTAGGNVVFDLRHDTYVLLPAVDDFYNNPRASDISADGATVVGNIVDRTGSGARGIVWTQNPDGSFSIDTLLSIAMQLHRVNANGVAIGAFISGPTHEAFLYDLATETIFDLTSAVNPDPTLGQVIAEDLNDAGDVVGWGWLGDRQGPWRWSPSTGASPLPLLPGAISSLSRAYGVNNDAAIVGSAFVDSIGRYRAWIWTADEGIHDLNDLALELPENFSLTSARRINDAGVIVGVAARGSALGGAAFIATPVPTTSACPGDTNGDNAVNFTDLNAVLADFGAASASLPGDVNSDNVVDFADLNAVLAAFGSTCN